MLIELRDREHLIRHIFWYIAVTFATQGATKHVLTLWFRVILRAPHPAVVGRDENASKES